MIRKVLITGSRHWMPKDKLWPFLDTLFDANPELMIIVGDAQGVDETAVEWAESKNCNYKKYYANWKDYGKAAGHKRNAKMIRENPDIDLCLAFPLPSSIGTYDCMRKAAAAGIPIKRFSIV